ncbi:hypothetical protein ABIE33_000331 [Ensifer sp. 4252]
MSNGSNIIDSYNCYICRLKPLQFHGKYLGKKETAPFSGGRFTSSSKNFTHSDYAAQRDEPAGGA